MADPTVILTDSQGHDLQAISDVVLDLAYGDDENDFTLIIRDSFDMTRFTRGSRVYMDGTEYGGIVDTVSSSVTTAGSIVQYSGRTWQGLLAHKIIAPDTGQDYLTVSGSVSSVLTSLFSRIKLDSIFVAQPDTRPISYQFERYVDAWTGIRKMAKASSLKPHMSYIKGQVHVSLLPVKTYEDVVDSDLLDFTATKNYRPVNHLIGLGTGELKNRAVSHWYANAAGEISETQTLFGLDEVVEIYDYSNAEAEELREETRKKLEELQSEGTIEVTLHDSDVTLDLGDNVAARDNTTGLTVTSEVSKKIIKIEDGVLSVNYEVGDESTSQSLSGSSESSGGGGALQNAEERLENPTFVNGFDGWSSQWRMTDGPQIDHSGVSRLLPVCDQAGGGYGNKYLQGSTTVPVNTGHVWQLQAWAKVLTAQSGKNLRMQLRWLDASGNQHWEWLKSLDASAKTDWTLLSATVKIPPMAVSATLWLHMSVQANDAVQVLVDSCSLKDVTGAAASFLAAWPIGSIYQTSHSTNPGTSYGGTWRSLPSQDLYLWERLT